MTNFTRRTALRSALGAGVAVAALGGPLGSIALAGPYRDPMDGFVLGPGPAGRCDDFKVGIPVVYRDPVDGRWMMWYFCRDQEFGSKYASSLGTGRVAFAVSENGRDWTRVDGPLEKSAVLVPGDEGSFDSVHLGVTDVIRVDGRFWMFYFGADDAPLNFRGEPVYGYRMRPGLAWSNDGINWTKVPGKAPGGAIIDFGDANWASWPNAIHDGEKFVLFYTTVEGDDPDFFYTHVTHSSNGVDWEYQGQIEWTDGPAFYDGRGMMTRHVLPDPTGENTWLMVYTAMDDRQGLEMRRSIAVAGSDDLMRWTHRADEPVLGPHSGTQAWDLLNAAAPHLVPTDDGHHLYYFGTSHHGDEKALPAGIGLAISSPLAPLKFTRIEAS